MIKLLMERIRELGAPICVGLDPSVDMLPDWLSDRPELEALLTLNRIVIDAVSDLVPAVKPQIAMYERYGHEGVEGYVRTTTYAKEKGLLVIGDIKRGDIGSTAAAYAAHIKGVVFDGAWCDVWREDAVTINPYLGYDSVKPWLDCCGDNKAVFILVKTSNPGSADLQDLTLASGVKVYEHVADLVSKWGETDKADDGYSNVGAVVGATFPEQGRALRKRMKHTFFLVPGYGAQGGTGADLKGFFDQNGEGCIVNSSRGIMGVVRASTNEDDATERIRAAVVDMRGDLQGGGFGGRSPTRS